ncbi:MAG TPA: hypothetical protein VJ914_21605 [Pseudonocardiaceae bacterium]|nr:hypothetical protein [Pseudonocardiaceae bacterium]
MRSILIWCGALLAWLLGNILGVVLHSSAITQFTFASFVSETNGDETITNSRTVVEPAITVLIFVILAVLWGVLILLMWLGQNWARIVQTVFAGLGLISLLITIMVAFRGIPGAGEGVQGALDLVSFVLIVMGIVTIYRAPANGYFRQRR